MNYTQQSILQLHLKNQKFVASNTSQFYKCTTWCLYFKTLILQVQFSILIKVILKTYLLYWQHIIDIWEKMFSCNYVENHNQNRNRVNTVA